MKQAWSETETAAAKTLVQLAVEEDLNGGEDLTSNLLIPAEQQAHVALVARAAGVLAGLPIVSLVLAELQSEVSINTLQQEGARIQQGEQIAELSGSLREILTAERTVLNFLTHLCGIATQTQRYVQQVAGTRAHIFDTRKTLPGWRALQKYAVRMGGGRNHRMGLYDALMLKDNHWAGISEYESVSNALKWLQTKVDPRISVIVEVDCLQQLEEALQQKIDVVLLDNMSLDELQRAVRIRDELSPAVQLEASGGVTLETVGAIAKTGVERISVGALTHSVKTLDLAFDWME